MAERSKVKRQTYLLNTAILTGYGDWQFEGPLSVERAREVLGGGFVSAIGHPAAAQFLATKLNTDIPANRAVVELQPGDQALVLRLKGRLPEGKVLSEEEMRGLPFELGLLTRLR